MVKARCRSVMFAMETEGHFWKHFSTFVAGAVVPAGRPGGKKYSRSNPYSDFWKSNTPCLCLVYAKSVSVHRGTVRRGLGNTETQPYFDSIERDPDKPFSVALPAAGKGSFSGWRHIAKEEVQELFE
jgi:hypothetical protein